MRNLRIISEIFASLQREGVLSTESSVLAVCANESDRDMFMRLGWRDVTITNLDEHVDVNALAPYRWSYEDAQKLSYDDDAFDVVFVCEGLHHCASPHRALCEMYRVCRRAIVAIEARDSFLLRAARALGFTADYEVRTVAGSDRRRGGVNGGCVPNYVYRWTEREVIKAISSYDPTARHDIRFHYSLDLPWEEPKRRSARRSAVRSLLYMVLSGLARVARVLLRRQVNTLGFVVIKQSRLERMWPWLELKDGEVVFREDYRPVALAKPHYSRKV